MHQYLEVRIVRLGPMRVASLVGNGETPEYTAWSAMIHWARGRELLDTEPPPRFFGQNVDPLPNSRADHAYEVWMIVGQGIWSDHIVKVKDFPGGLYAVTRVTGVEDIFPAWQRLEKWVEASNFQFSNRFCLEELLTFPNLLHDDFEVDLFLPIEE